MKCFIPEKIRDRPARATSAHPTPSIASISTSNGWEANVSDSQVSSDASTRSSKNSFSGFPQMRSDLRAFTFSEMKAATKNFNRTLIIGEGGFGCVYRGVIKTLADPNKKIEIAVKQLGKRGLQGHKEWVTEVNVLGVVEHTNLVKLIGYCAEDDERGMQRLLVYEYMHNRSVQDHLSTRNSATIRWITRLKIAQDAARGLAHLHQGMEFQIIFRDFKSSNILLDENWNAKLSDFGLARLGPPDGNTHVSTAVVGTLGYASPDYLNTGRLTCKNDVWSYGVFLYELLTGKRPMDRNRPKNEQLLLEWVKPYIGDSKSFTMIMDPRLEGKYDLRSARKLSIVANRCLVKQPKMRPAMGDVLKMVTKIVDGAEGGSPVKIVGNNLRVNREFEAGDEGCWTTFVTDCFSSKIVGRWKRKRLLISKCK